MQISSPRVTRLIVVALTLLAVGSGPAAYAVVEGNNEVPILVVIADAAECASTLAKPSRAGLARAARKIAARLGGKHAELAHAPRTEFVLSCIAPKNSATELTFRSSRQPSRLVAARHPALVREITQLADKHERHHAVYVLGVGPRGATAAVHAVLTLPSWVKIKALAIVR